MDTALTQEIKALALSLGFARVGVARATMLDEDRERLQAWLSAGYHGQMAYMPETAEVRADPRHPSMLESACSVVVLATAYDRAPLPEGLEPARVARYAHGRDYHALLYDRTRALKRRLRAAGAVVRSCVDTMPVLERAWAARAGVGFIGKNACLIVPGLGSHVLLTVLVTSAALVADEPMEERCGSCRLCLDACPTRAFAAPRVLDARRCISYLTIEHEGAIDPELRAEMGTWLFGCDVCQDVCPYNRGKVSEEVASYFAPRGRWAEVGTEDFLKMSDEVYDEYTRGSPLRRPGRESMARNAAIVLGNARDKRHLPLLTRVSREDPSAVVRDAAQWALSRLLAS
jgi:epoxyqueuosine reductase